MHITYKNYDDKIRTLADWIQESKYTIIFTGAGMSTESGIPDFRSKEGLWKGIDPMSVATVDVLEKDYDNFYEFYKMRVNNLKGCKPHKGYDILSRWEKEGLVHSIVTQNIDGFHKIAGNNNIITLHGSINDFRCNNCSQSANFEDFMDKKPCVKCGGVLRPNVILFGEGLDQNALNRAVEEMKKAELVIIIGTSLMVYPVNQLPKMSSGKKVYINKDNTSEDSFDLYFDVMAGKILQDVDDLIHV